LWLRFIVVVFGIESYFVKVNAPVLFDGAGFAPEYVLVTKTLLSVLRNVIASKCNYTIFTSVAA
jgi:hypothetical protein